MRTTLSTASPCWLFTLLATSNCWPGCKATAWITGIAPLPMLCIPAEISLPVTTAFTPPAAPMVASVPCGVSGVMAIGLPATCPWSISWLGFSAIV
ncbi:Uncharacterised protein [Serratia quinivorans]|nr:Uncharacterised protein [Serratia quinivorans]CAI1954387.1 Uncharacterised protein [Serratia quinivorans]